MVQNPFFLKLDLKIRGSANRKPFQNQFSRMPGWFIILPISRTSSIVRTASKIDRPLMKPFSLAGISNGITASYRLRIALDAIFTSTLTNKIALQFLRNLLSFPFFSNSVINACFCELDNAPC